MKKANGDRASAKSPKEEGFAPIGHRLLAYILSQLHNAERELSLKGLARHEGIHKARKHIRRSKAALAVAGAKFGSRGKRIEAELSHICRGLSKLRDAQALVETLQRLHASDSGSSQSIVAKAGSAARRHRNQLMAKALVRDPNLLARRRRLQCVSEKLQRLDWESICVNDAVMAIQRSKRRLAKTAKRVTCHFDDDESWHGYRRKLRRLCQQSKLLENLGISNLRLDKAFESQSSMLSEAQDDVLLMKYCSRRSPFTLEQRRQLRMMADQRLCDSRRHWMPLF